MARTLRWTVGVALALLLAAGPAALVLPASAQEEAAPKLEDLPLELIGEVIRRMPAKRFIALYENVLKDMRRTAAKKNSPKKVSSQKKPAKKAAPRSSNERGRATRSAAGR